MRYPWGDVPYEFASGYDNTIMFQTEVDCTLDSHVYISVEPGDDPTYAQAMRGPERQQWVDAREDEMNALRDLGVIILTPADAVPHGEDIYDTMALCKRKGASWVSFSSTRSASCCAAIRSSRRTRDAQSCSTRTYCLLCELTHPRCDTVLTS